MDDYNTNWKIELEAAMGVYDETWDDVVSNTMTEEQMLQEFDQGFGGIEGCAFTVWTKYRVYFPTDYDGAEGVDSVSRYPDGVPTQHI